MRKESGPPRAKAQGRAKVGLPGQESRFFKIVADFTWDWELWIGPNGAVRYCSPSAERITGCAPEAFHEDPSLLLRIIHPDDRPSAQAHFLDPSEGEDQDPLEYRILRPDASVRWIEHQCQAVRGSKGEFLGRRVSNRDITGRKRREEVQEARLRLSEYAHGHSLRDVLQKSLDELESLTGSQIGFYHFVDDDQLSIHLQAWSTNTLLNLCTAEGKGTHYDLDKAGVWVDCVREGKPVIHNDYASLPGKKGLPPGHATVVREITVPVFEKGRVAAILGVGNKATDYDADDLEVTLSFAQLAWDIAGRKRAEETLLQLHLRLEQALKFNEALLSAIPTPVFYKDREGRYLGCNRAFSEIMGVTPEEMKGKTVYELWPSEHARTYHEKDLALMSNPARQVYEFKVRDKEGADRPVIYAKDVFRDENDRVAGIVGGFLDITERKQAEEALRAERGLFVGGPTVVFKWKAQEGWPVEYVSPNVADQFGYTPEDFTSGRVPYATTVHPDDLARVAAEVSSYSEQGVASFEQEYRILRTDGRYRWVQDFTTVMRGPDGAITDYLGYILDITERKEAEESAAQRSRQLEVLSRASRRVNVTLETPVVLRQLVAAALELTGAADGAAGLMLDGQMVFKEYNAGGRLTPIDYRFAEGFGVPGWVMNTREPYVSNDAENDPHVIPEIQKALGFHNLADIPVFGRRDELLGCFEIHNKPGGFDETDLVMLQGLAASTAIALENAAMLAERAQAEQELARLNRALRMLSDCNQALVRIVDEAALLSEVCRIAVEVGGYRLAWVGFAEQDDERAIRPVAQAGLDAGYVQSVNITWRDDERGRGPGGTAIRTGRPSIARNVPSDPALALWREEATRRGFESIIALPLTSGARTLGVLAIYSGEEDAFDSREVEILNELAFDLTYGIIALRTRGDRDQAEEQLRESEERYRLIAENTADTITVLDLGLHPVYVSPSVQKLRGYSAEETIVQSLDQILTPDSLDKVNKAFADQMAMEADEKADPSRAVRLELEEYRRDGSTIWVELAASFLRDSDSKPTGILTVTRDITTRKRVEEDLSISELRYRTLFEGAAEGILVADIGTKRFLYANPAICELLGYSESELRQLSVADIHPNDEIGHVLSEFAAQARGEKTLASDLPCLRKDGKVIYADIKTSKALIDDKECNVGFFTDITERKQAEEERKGHIRFLESLARVDQAIKQETDLERMLRNIVGTVFAIFDCDRAWLFYPCDPDSPSFRVPMEITKPEYPGAGVLNVDVPMPPDMSRNLREALESAGPVTYVAGTERSINKMSAEQFNVASMMFVALYPKMGKPWLFGMHQCSYPRIWTNEERRLFQEISRRVSDGLSSALILHELEENEERFRATFEQAAVGIAHVAPDGRWIRVNKKLCDIVGYSREELLQKTFQDITHPDDLNADLEYVRQVLAGEIKMYDMEKRYVRKDGSFVWIDLTVSLVRDAFGAPGYFISVVEDITERRRAEIALRDSEEKYRLLAENAHDCVAVLSSGHRYLFASPSYETVVGYAPSEILGRRTTDFLHPGDLEAFERAHQDALARRLPNLKIEYRFCASDGQYRWFEGLTTFLYDDDGGCTRIQRVARDITGRKKMEEALRDREARYRSIFEQSPIALWELDCSKVKAALDAIPEAVNPDAGSFLQANPQSAKTLLTLVRVTDMNPAALALYGASSKKDFLRRLPRVLAERPFNLFGRALLALARGEATFTGEGQIVTLDGRSLQVSAIASAAKGSESRYDRVFFSCLDITQIRELQTFLQMQSKAFETMQLGVTITDPSGTILYTNPADAAMHGFSLQELQGKNARILGPSELWETDPRYRMKSWARDSVNIRKDGSTFRVRLHSDVVQDDEGRPFAVVTICEDIEVRRQTEDRLRDLSIAVEQSPAALIITDRQGAIKYVNPAFESLTGYSREEALGRTPSFLKSGKHDDAFYRDMWDKVARGDVWAGNLTNRKKDGTLYLSESTITAIVDGIGAVAGYLQIQWDITEREATREHLRRAREMEALGHLVAGVAHEIRNPLNAIQASVAALLMDIPESEDSRELGALIRGQVDRLSTLTRDLLEIGRPPRADSLHDEDPADLMRRAVASWKGARSGLHHPVELVRTGQDSGVVKVDAARFQHAFFNLLDNADHFSPPGEPISVEILQRDGTCVIRVSDRGTGVPPELLPRVFEPFFTSRRGGTGLGLVLVKAFAEGLGGSATLRNNDPSPGCTVEVCFPIALEKEGRSLPLKDESS